MKYLIVFSVIAAVASAGYLKPAPVASEVSEIEEIIAAINSPSTDPATAAALEQLLLEQLGISPAPVPAPVFVEEPAPISIGPAIIDFPLPDGGALTPGLTPVETPAPVEAPIVPAPVETPIVPAPAAVAEAATAPLVQIILNINQASDVAAVAPSPAETPVIVESPVAVAPVNVVESPVAVAPVNVVDEAVNVEGPSPAPVAIAPIVIVDPAVVPSPVQVVPEAIQVIEVAPAPVVTLPDILN